MDINPTLWEECHKSPETPGATPGLQICFSSSVRPVTPCQALASQGRPPPLQPKPVGWAVAGKELADDTWSTASLNGPSPWSGNSGKGGAGKVPQCPQRSVVQGLAHGKHLFIHPQTSWLLPMRPGSVFCPDGLGEEQIRPALLYWVGSQVSWESLLHVDSEDHEGSTGRDRRPCLGRGSCLSGKPSLCARGHQQVPRAPQDR